MVKPLFFFLSIVLIIIFDQWTKFIVISRFEYGESLPVFGNFFSLTYVRNTGAAFGFLANANPTFRVPFFLIVPIVAMVVLGFLYRDLPSNAKWRGMALGLVSGVRSGTSLTGSVSGTWSISSISIIRTNTTFPHSMLRTPPFVSESAFFCLPIS